MAALLAGFFGALGIAGAAGLAVLAVVTPPAAWTEAAPFLATGWVAPSDRMLFWTFVQAAGSLVAVGMISKGYQSGETSLLAVFEYFFLVSAAFWAWLLWGDRLDAPTAAGIALIAAAGIVIAGARPPAQAAAAG